MIESWFCCGSPPLSYTCTTCRWYSVSAPLRETRSSAHLVPRIENHGSSVHKETRSLAFISAHHRQHNYIQVICLLETTSMAHPPWIIQFICLLIQSRFVANLDSKIQVHGSFAHKKPKIYLICPLETRTVAYLHTRKPNPYLSQRPEPSMAVLPTRTLVGIRTCPLGLRIMSL